MIRLPLVLFLSATLFSIGVYGVLARRKAVLVLMSIELMLNAVNINLVAFGAALHDLTGQVFALFVITVVVFAIVVTERLIGERLAQVSRRVAIAAVTCAALMAALVRAIAVADVHLPKQELSGDLTAQMGTSLLTRYVLPFELLAVLLVVGLLAASYFARPED